MIYISICNFFFLYNNIRYFKILHCRQNYCDIIANIRYIAQPKLQHT